VAIFAGIHGYLDDVPTPQVPRFQDELREALRVQGAAYGEIRETKDLSDELQERLHAEIKRFRDSFAVREEAGLMGAAG
jgi:F-type H+-transporting ATPase subunit alpha